MATAFTAKKQKILDALNVPEEAYSDLSPKGSIDAGIRHLISEINSFPGLVTTSSCAGRISIFLEGKKKRASAAAATSEATSSAGGIAGPGGKGGGRWLFVSHEPEGQGGRAASAELYATLGMKRPQGEEDMPPDASLVHFKFEPMILHVLAASLGEANAVLNAASQAGFRESGAMGLTRSRDGTTSPMVAVRSAGLSFDSIIGYQSLDGGLISLIDETYLDALVRIANGRFETNTERISRFRLMLQKNMGGLASAE